MGGGEWNFQLFTCNMISPIFNKILLETWSRHGGISGVVYHGLRVNDKVREAELLDVEASAEDRKQNET